MNDIIQKVKSPAIGLLVTGILSGLLALLSLLSGLLRLLGVTGKEALPVNESERIGYFIGTFISYGIAFVCLITAPLIIYGAMQMLSMRNYKFAKTASILAIIPLTTCCFLIGIPIGIWAFTVLNKPEVRAVFDNENNPQNFYPPPPNF